MRQGVFKKQKMPLWQHHTWWFLHNAVAHPMLGIAPSKLTFRFHDWTSRKLMGK